jgi:predicted nucleic acid-binding protein
MTAVVNALYDTNILLYAVDNAPASATKRAKAIELMLQRIMASPHSAG